MPTKLIKYLIMLTLLLFVGSSGLLQVSAQTLPRRGHLGAQIGTLTPAIKKAYGLSDTLEGIIFYKIFPNFAAHSAELQPLDILMQIEHQNIKEAQALVQTVANANGGDTLNCLIRRNDSLYNQKLILGFYPRENNLLFETFYTGVKNEQGDTLSLILTKPHQLTKPAPLVCILPKDKKQSVEFPFEPRGALYAYIETFTLQGMVTLRIEQRGCGDDRRSADSSQQALLTDWKAALDILNRYAFIDPKNIFLVDQAGNQDAHVIYQKLNFPWAGFISSSPIGNPTLLYDPNDAQFLRSISKYIQ